MAKPIVGTTTYVTSANWDDWHLDAALIPLDYVRGVDVVGRRPLLVPPSDEGVDETLAVLFSGGSDHGVPCISPGIRSEVQWSRFA